MKYKYLFLSFMLLILVGSITAIAANEASIGDYTFTLPDGYTIANQTEDLISMTQDDDHAIVISDPEVVKSSEEFKADLEADGYEFGDEANYTSGNFDIEQYNYNQDSYKGFLYICHDNTDDDEVLPRFITFFFFYFFLVLFFLFFLISISIHFHLFLSYCFFIKIY